MFVSNHLRKYIAFLIGFLLSGMMVSIALLGIASLLDTNADSKAASPRLDQFAEIDGDSKFGNVSCAQFDEFLDGIDTSTKPTSKFAGNTTLYAMLMQADSKLLVDFFKSAKNVSNGFWRREILSAILKRLTTIAPSQALDCASKLPIEQRQALLGAVFHEWSLLNLSDAVNAGSHLDPPERKNALTAIVQARVDLPEERLIAIGQIFGYEKYVRRLMDVSRVEGFVDTPQEAWEALIGDGRDLRFRLDTAVDVAQMWVNRDGIGALTEILEYDTESTLASSAFNLMMVQSVARSDPEAIFEQSIRDEKFQFLAAEIAEVWAETNPVDALNRVSVLDDASDRVQLTRAIMRIWSETNPRELIERRSVLPKDVQLSAISLAIGSIASTAPHEAIQLMENLRAEEVNTWVVAESLVNVWSENDPAATLDWVLSGSNDQNPLFARIVETTVRKLARVDPDRAMHLALNPLKSTWPTALDYKVIDEIAQTDVDVAAKLLPRVSDKYRARSYRKVGFEYVVNGNPENAIQLAEHLDPQQRDSYYSDTLDTWAMTNSDTLLKAMVRFPSSRVQELAAHALIYRNEDRHFLSEKQLEKIKTYLSKEPTILW